MSDPYQPTQPYSTPDSSGEPAGGPPSGEPRPEAPQPPPGQGQQPGSPPPGYGQGAQPGYGQQPGYPPAGYQAAGYPPPYAPDPPGKVMGIIGFVLAFVFAPAGIVVSAMALSDSKKVGYDNALGKWGLWLSIIFTAIALLIVLAYLLFAVLLFGSLATTSY